MTSKQPLPSSPSPSSPPPPSSPSRRQLLHSRSGSNSSNSASTINLAAIYTSTMDGPPPPPLAAGSTSSSSSTSNKVAAPKKRSSTSDASSTKAAAATTTKTKKNNSSRTSSPAAVKNSALSLPKPAVIEALMHNAKPIQYSNNSTPSMTSEDVDSMLDSYATADSTAAAAAAAPIDVDNGDLSRLTRDQLLALIARERTEKEEVEMRLVSISTDHAILSETHSELCRAHLLGTSKTQAAFDTASRLEAELASQAFDYERMTTQIKEAEKENRDLSKRHLEEMEVCALERLNAQDAELELNTKLRKLQADLESARTAKQPMSPPPSSVPLSPPPKAFSPSHRISDSHMLELQALQLRLNNLSTEHERAVLQATSALAEVEELQRYTAELQEQNENYEALLSERMLLSLSPGLPTLHNEVHNSNRISKTLNGGSSLPSSSLEALHENDEDQLLEDEVLEVSGSRTISSDVIGSRHRRTASGDSSHNNANLSLEAEFGRAEQDEEERAKAEADKKRKDAITARRKANASSHLGGRDGDPVPMDLDTLTKEVRLLRQENKGLTTYVGKILERVIGMEGFEKVLAVDKDFKAAPPTSIAGISHGSTGPAAISPELPAPAVPPKSTGWQRPAFLSTLSSSSTMATMVQPSVSTPVSPTVLVNSNQTTPAQQQQQSLPDRKKNNRMSMDAWVPSFWRGTSASGPSNSASNTTASTSSAVATAAQQAALQPPLPGFKPMMLGSRRLSNDMEDEADQITRARLQSEMKLLGLDNAGSPILHSAPVMAGLPAGSRLSVGRSPSNRLSGLFSSLSGPTAASPNASANLATPPRDDTTSARDRDSRSDTFTGRTSGLTEPLDKPSVTSGVESVKLRGAGHRKRPSAGTRDSLLGSASASPAQGLLHSPSHPGAASVGLGFSYSSGGSSSISGARSPSVTSVSGGGGDSSKEGHRTSDQSIRSDVSQS